MNLPKAVDAWEAAGYKNWKLIRAWKRILNSYCLAFTAPICLAINRPLKVQSQKVLNDVVDFALDKHPNKMRLQHNGLKEYRPFDDDMRVILREASKKTIVGYQLLGGIGWLEEEVGDRVKALENAKADHASYVEVHASDFRDDEIRKQIHDWWVKNQ